VIDPNKTGSLSCSDWVKKPVGLGAMFMALSSCGRDTDAPLFQK
jgi:hypothetical protein